MHINAKDIQHIPFPIKNIILLPNLFIQILLHIHDIKLTKPFKTFAKLISVILLSVIAPTITPA